MRGVAPRESMLSTDILPALQSSRVSTAVGIFSHALGRHEGVSVAFLLHSSPDLPHSKWTYAAHAFLWRIQRV